VVVCYVRCLFACVGERMEELSNEIDDLKDQLSHAKEKVAQ